VPQFCAQNCARGGLYSTQNQPTPAPRKRKPPVNREFTEGSRGCRDPSPVR
jgi:hypothetical protein